jgi:hypothetical protein
MGGIGSGSHGWRPVKKETVEDCLSFDANRWAREGILREGARRSGSWHWTYASGRACSIGYEVVTVAGTSFVRLYYTREQAGQKEASDYRVGLTTTRPRFGGRRWWFVCPLVVNGRPCNRRVGKLYLPPGARYFGCRHCHRLTYTSCQERRKHGSLYRLLAEGTGMDPALVKWAMESIGKRRR